MVFAPFAVVATLLWYGATYGSPKDAKPTPCEMAQKRVKDIRGLDTRGFTEPMLRRISLVWAEVLMLEAEACLE